MKKSKKIILGSEAVLISLASFGCVYGPPPSEDVMKLPADEISVTENIETDGDGQNAEAEKQGVIL